ncbi:hypothetical protein CMUS01_16618 [Colletotrichum musicola]|uniref:Uncharacterized protein n=1 Tax=Colletotrichum musicola TaxID=2175873 RepID=A0A8H6IM99_9PEZI|nr:hypothetical protein CMUS01_16618 [Colletotrichum musicola]
MHTHTQTRRRSSSIRSKSRSRRATRSSKDEEAPAGLGLLTAQHSVWMPCPGSSWESTLPTEDFPKAVDGSLMPQALARWGTPVLQAHSVRREKEATAAGSSLPIVPKSSP